MTCWTASAPAKLTSMRRARRPQRHPLAGVLWANALALGLLGAAVLQSRSAPAGRGIEGLTFPGLLPSANAQGVPPIAGGAGLYLMPAQLASNIWGVYVMDVDRQSLLVYQFDASDKKLNFLAARQLTHDRLLGNYNTFPNPLEIKSIADKERQTGRLPDDAGREGQPQGQ